MLYAPSTTGWFILCNTKGTLRSPKIHCHSFRVILTPHIHLLKMNESFLKPLPPRSQIKLTKKLLNFFFLKNFKLNVQGYLSVSSVGILTLKFETGSFIWIKYIIFIALLFLSPKKSPCTWIKSHIIKDRQTAAIKRRSQFYWKFNMTES